MPQNATLSAHFWKLRCRKKCTPMWREAHFEVKLLKTHENTTRSAHFWKLRFWKSARHCGATHMCKSNVQKATRLDRFWKLRCRKKAHAVVGRSKFWSQNVEKHHRFRPLFEVEMLNRCTLLWHEAHLEVKIIKKKLPDHFWTFNRASLHYITTQTTSTTATTAVTTNSTATTATTLKLALPLPSHIQLQRQLQLHYNCNYNYNCTNYITPQLQTQWRLQLHYSWNYTTLRCTTLHPAVVGEETIATTPKSTTPTTCLSISGFALPSMSHSNLTSPIGFLSLKLPPPHCAVLLVKKGCCISFSNIAFVRRYGYVVIMLNTPSIFCRNYATMVKRTL